MDVLTDPADFDPDDDGKAWAHQPGETLGAYHAFRTYLLLGHERSLKLAMEKLGLKSNSMLGNWSSEHRWRERCVAYDSYILNAEVEGYAHQVASVRSYHMEITGDLLTQLHTNLKMMKPGQDPSIRWTQALAVALKSQQAALQMKEESDKPNGVLEQIMKSIARLAEGSDE